MTVIIIGQEGHKFLQFTRTVIISRFELPSFEVPPVLAQAGNYFVVDDGDVESLVSKKEKSVVWGDI